jgi:hypothetical protein
MPFIPIAATSLENTFTAKQTVLDDLRVGVPAGSALETALNAQLGAQSAIIGGDTQGWSEHFIGGTEGFWEPGVPYRGTQVTLGHALMGGGWAPGLGIATHEWLDDTSSWFTHYRPNGTYFYPLSFNSTLTVDWALFDCRVQMHKDLRVAPSAAQAVLTSAVTDAATFVSGDPAWTTLRVLGQGNINSSGGAGIQLGRVNDGVTPSGVWELGVHHPGDGVSQTEFYAYAPDAAGVGAYYFGANIYKTGMSGVPPELVGDKYFWVNGHMDVGKTIRMGGWSTAVVPPADGIDLWTLGKGNLETQLYNYSDASYDETVLTVYNKATTQPYKYSAVEARLGTPGSSDLPFSRFEIENDAGTVTGRLNFRFAAGSARALTVTPTAWTFGGNRIDLGATQILTTRRTGWEAPTGTATRTTFATANVTTANLAQRVKALIDDLMAHGIIGA